MEHILVVDDDGCVLDSVRCFLQHVGYEVETASSGQEGISLIDSGNEYDLVITDIRMPGMSGNELAKHIRNSDWTYTPIIAITGYHDAVDQKLFDGILLKPGSIEQVLNQRVRRGRVDISLAGSRNPLVQHERPGDARQAHRRMAQRAQAVHGDGIAALPLKDRAGHDIALHTV